MYLGLGKTLYNSSACLIEKSESGPLIEILLMERLVRKKACGLWPERAISSLMENKALSEVIIAENRDVITPLMKENMMEERFPFFDYLQKNGLTEYSSKFNKRMKFVTHHAAHAWSAAMMSPFEEALILVLDGAGTALKDFPKDHPELEFDIAADPESLEYCTVYHFNKGSLKCIKKEWQRFFPSENHKRNSFSSGVGIFYEKIAEFIFNSNQAAGKVMGLAPFGKRLALKDEYYEFLENLNWEEQSFKGKSKSEWENSPHRELYQNLAATAQNEYEKFVNKMIEGLPDLTDTLVLSGGCALNCTANMKILKKGHFDEVYVTPFPGDESIGLGCASWSYHLENEWRPMNKKNQHGYFGPTSSIPLNERVKEVFKDFALEHFSSIEKECAKYLFENKIIAWFQGRSESGPRALGNRSILARVDFPDIKNVLNEKIKFREKFRPYGCSVLFEEASRYFEFPEKFETPYMSFAVPVKKEKDVFLKEVSHIDGTSRMQTVRKGQNERYYNLLRAYGDLAGDPVLLNTSLNIMGEPIIETLDDLRNFYLISNVDLVVAGNYVIHRK